MSIRQKKYADHLTTWNCKRSLQSGKMLAVLFPVLGALFFFMKEEETTAFWAVLIVAEVVQLIAISILIYVTKKNKRDTMSALYKLYYVLTVLSLLMLSALEYMQSKSLLLLMGAMAYYVFVPVLSQKEQRTSAYIILVLAVFYCIAVFNMGIRAIVDTAIVLAAAVILGRYSQDNIRYKEKLESELEEKTISSEHDALTGLMNRWGLEKQVEYLWPYCARIHAPIGVIEIDIDFFKKYNDKFGHPEGDKCLQKIANVLHESARRSSDLAVRIGGEEFVVLVQNMTEGEIVKYALMIRNKVEELKIPHAYDGISKYVTVSMGAAYTYPNEENSYQQLYKAADKALYKAKENGRNCVACGDSIYRE